MPAGCSGSTRCRRVRSDRRIRRRKAALDIRALRRGTGHLAPRQSWGAELVRRPRWRCRSGFAVIRVRRFPLVSVLAAATPALALGDAIGRVGCFLVGDDYGRPRTCRGPSRSLAGCRGPLFPYIRHNSTKRYRSCFSRGHSSDGVGLAFLTGSFSVDTACWLAPYASRSNSFA